MEHLAYSELVFMYVVGAVALIVPLGVLILACIIGPKLWGNCRSTAPRPNLKNGDVWEKSEK